MSTEDPEQTAEWNADETTEADGVEIAPAEDSPPETFEVLGLRREVLEALQAMGFERPTEVEAKAIPPALEGHDLLVQSRTGTGKTAAFGIPLVQSLVDESLSATQALILCPTRELAIQVAEELRRIAAKTRLRATPIYGGAAMGPQVEALASGTEIVAGTPGRVLDHLRRRTFKAEAVRVLILDEADEMLSMGFFEEISAILEHLPEERQTMLFSATIPEEIQRLSERHLREPVELYLSEDFVGVFEIQHVYYLISGGNRHRDLLRVLEYEAPETGLIFCNTRADTAFVADFLQGQGFSAEGISSDLSQREREEVMTRMRERKARFLVATDIAARGIDIEDISHVINYDFPESADVYVHRTGRTGRAGKSGVAVSLVGPREIGSFYYLRLIHKIFPEERQLPSPEEIEARREADRAEMLRRRFAGQTPSKEARGLGRRIGSLTDADDLIGMMAMELLGPDASPDTARLAIRPRSRPRPQRERRPSGDGRRSKSPTVRSERTAGRTERGHRRVRARDADRDSGAPARRTRTRRSEAFTTADGEVEYYETLDPSDVGAAEMTRLYVNVGSRHRISAGDIAEFFRSEAGLEPSQIGDISVKDRHTYVSVASGVADGVVDAVNGKTLQERALRVERAKR